MTRFLLLLLTLCCFGTVASAQLSEDFEGATNTLNFNADGAGQGLFRVIANPDPSGINPSDSVAAYTKEAGAGFSLLIATLDQPLDLSGNAEFAIDVWAPIASEFIFKLEGPGAAVEQRQNIATANTWRTYTFDLSAQEAATTLDRVILFFEPGVADSDSTYYFDNIRQLPNDDCTGTAVDPLVIDDFECQRNGTVGAGFDVLTVVANPDPSGINTSDSVGEYVDPPGTFSALVYDYNTPIDLSMNPVFKIKVWAPVTGNLLGKVEGGSGPNLEIPMQVTTTNEWVEYSYDFSAAAGAGHTRLVFFFNAGAEPGPDDVYYVDDIVRAPAPPAMAIEDFENGATLTWEPQNGGTFNVITNPDTDGNDSDNVGEYVRGGANFSAISALLTDGLDLSGNPQINMDVWLPDGGSTVTMQLVSGIQGITSATQTVSETMSWQTLNFDFSSISDVTDIERINLLFDEGTGSTGTYYFDNIVQGQSTVDPCEGVEANSFTVDDFECQRNYAVSVGADQLDVVDNPDTDGNNSPTVGAFTDGTGSFEALVFELGDDFDFSVYNQFKMDVWAPMAPVPVLVKLEGGPTGGNQEVFVDVTEAMSWQTITADLSASADADYTKLVLFFNAGNDTSEDMLYYIDNLRFTPAPYTDCILNFDNAGFESEFFGIFPDDQTVAVNIIDNPDPSGINTSDRVGEFIELASGTQPWGGAFFTLPAPIFVNGPKVVTMKVWAPVAGDIAIKLENSPNGAPNTGDVIVTNDVTNEWVELSFDVSVVPDDAEYSTFTLIMNIGEIPTQDNIFYFDDVAIDGRSCDLTTGVFSAPTVRRLDVFPNPVSAELTVRGTREVRRLEVHNLLGHRLTTRALDGSESARLDVGQLPTGMYLLTAYDRNGALIGNSRFNKQ